MIFEYCLNVLLGCLGFSYSECQNQTHMYMGFRDALNFQNFKVVLNPLYSFFKTELCQKLNFIMLINIL